MKARYITLSIKPLIFIFLTYLLGLQTTYAKTEVAVFGLESSVPAPQMLRSFRVVDNMITSIDNEIDLITNLNRRAKLKNYFSEVKLRIRGNGSSGYIPNILNRIDNAENTIVSVAKNEQPLLGEIQLTNGSVTTNGKKFWAQHEMNVSKYLEDTYGVSNIGQQITVDVYIAGRSTPVRCRIDNLIDINGNGELFRIVDAKSSIVNDLSTKTALQLKNTTCTPNQKLFYDALKNGNVTQIKPVGNRAKVFFEVETLDDLPQN